MSHKRKHTNIIFEKEKNLKNNESEKKMGDNLESTWATFICVSTACNSKREETKEGRRKKEKKGRRRKRKRRRGED